MCIYVNMSRGAHGRLAWIATVVPTKSDSDVILSLQMSPKNNSYALLDLA